MLVDGNTENMSGGYAEAYLPFYLIKILCAVMKEIVSVFGN